MKLQNKKIAILLEQEYQELEAWVPYYRFIEEGAKVILAAPEEGEVYLGKHGYPATSTSAISELSSKEYDAVIIPGGFAPDYLRRVKESVEFVKAMHKKGNIVASICHGAWLLASAEIITGKMVTTYFAIKDDIIHAGGTYTDEAVVQDGNIITSRTQDDLPVFCRTIINALAE